MHVGLSAVCVPPCSEGQTVIVKLSCAMTKSATTDDFIGHADCWTISESARGPMVISVVDGGNPLEIDHTNDEMRDETR